MEKDGCLRLWEEGYTSKKFKTTLREFAKWKYLRNPAIRPQFQHFHRPKVKDNQCCLKQSELRITCASFAALIRLFGSCRFLCLWKHSLAVKSKCLILILSFIDLLISPFCVLTRVVFIIVTPGSLTYLQEEKKNKSCHYCYIILHFTVALIRTFSSCCLLSNIYYRSLN